MVVTKRIAAVFGALTLASTLVACGGAPREVDADQPDQPDQPEGEQVGGSTEESGEQAQDEPFDGNTVTFSNITEDNIDGLCTELFGEVEDVLTSLELDTADIDMDSYSGWTESYEEQVGSIAATFGCHATASTNADDAESVHINVASGMGEPSGVNHVSERSDDMSAGMALLTSDRPDDEILASYLKDDVLPKFRP